MKTITKSDNYFRSLNSIKRGNICEHRSNDGKCRRNEQ